MGLDDSPLKDRVVFVEGAPRSGTTMLISLFASHPEIAAIISESRLFDRGVGCLFENHEIDPSVGTHLAAYLSRDELRDAVRDLCDRTLITMHDRVNPDAKLVAEKTPAQRTGYAETLSRKLECYPDARYVHVVRDRKDVVRSLSRSPWTRGSLADFSEHWRSAVETARSALDGNPNYLEIPYRDLADDPVATMGRTFDWLRVDHGDAVLARVEAMSRERISTHGPGHRRDPDAHGAVSRLRRTLGGIVRRGDPSARRGKAAGGAEALATRLMEALREGDERRIVDLTRDDVLLELRSGAGDLRADGDDARRLLFELGREMFGQRFVSESWSVNEGDPAVTFQIAAVSGDTTRLDACISVIVREDRVVHVGVISAGDPGGRQAGEWLPRNPVQSSTASPA